MWSAAVDPRVLSVRALATPGGSSHIFDGGSPGTWIARGTDREVVRVERGGGPVRLDVIEGTVAAGPVALRFDVADDDRIEHQVAAIRALHSAVRRRQQQGRFARLLLALHAVDARDAGASLRQTADILLGAGDWPGDGDHRKSSIRRLIVAGERMIRAGPAAILRLR